MEGPASHLQHADRLDAPMRDGTKMGHVHLHVADVDDALRFYHDLVGFDVMGHVPGMGFVSAGGYQHHLGLNEWGGPGARPGPAGVAGLAPPSARCTRQTWYSVVVARARGGSAAHPLHDEDH